MPRHSLNLVDYCRETGGDALVSKLFSTYTGIDAKGNKHSPYDVTYGSNIEVYWKCPKGHLKLQRISYRMKNPYVSCPICKAQLEEDDSLVYWCNTHKFGETILKEWTGITEDGKHIDISNMQVTSDLKVKWQCSNNHYWYKSIAARTAEQLQCQVCRAKTKTKNGKYSVETVIKQKSIKDIFIDACDIHNVSPKDIWYRSKIRTQWKCTRGHIYEVEAFRKCLDNYRCPQCVDDDVWGERGLAFWCSQNKIKSQRLVSEWTGRTVDNTQVNMNDIDTFDSTQMVWKCINNHEYISTVKGIIYTNNSCPICNKKYSSTQYKLLKDKLTSSFKEVYDRSCITTSNKESRFTIDFAVKDCNIAIQYIPAYWGEENTDRIRQELKKKNMRLLVIKESTPGNNGFRVGNGCITFDFSDKDNYTKLVSLMHKTVGDKNEKV